jgi:hypothetical protein
LRVDDLSLGDFMKDAPARPPSTIGARFWITWALCYLGMLALIGLGWLYNSTEPRATAGLAEEGQSLPPRLGFVLIPALIPLLIGAFGMAKIRDRGSAARVVVPVLLSILLVSATWFDAFMPDVLGCGGFELERFGPLDPECTTAIETRWLALGEMTAAWILFALAAVLFDRVRRFRAARAA